MKGGGYRNLTFPDYFESITGCRPSNRGQSCAKTYRSLVLTGKIAEGDYDEHTSDAIQTASRVISRVDDNLEHPAVAEAAAILRQRDRSAIAELKALLDRLIQDPNSGRVTLRRAVEDAGVEPKLSYVPALELARKIANEGHQSVLAEPLKEKASLTADADEARSLAITAARIQANLESNCDAQGRRRFSDEMINSWTAQIGLPKIVTEETLRRDFEAAKMRLEETKRKLNEAGLAPADPEPSQPVIVADTFQRVPRQGIVLKRWRGAEAGVLDLLRSLGWQVEDVSLRKLGYDITGKTPEGDDAFVEVKSINSPSQAFTFTSREEAVAREKGASYRLALVRLTNTHLEVAFISNPVRRLKFVQTYRQIVWECAEYEFEPDRYPLE